jgi:hypothetical protein
MASKRPAQAAAHAAAPAHDPRDEIIAALQNQLATMENRFAALESMAGAEVLPPQEMPVFEIGPGGYYSADDVLYAEGVQIEDLTGRMPLNEQLIPLNEAAQRRMEQYLARLPQHGTPNHEFVLEAAFRQLGTLNGMGDTPEARAEFGARVLEEAAKLRMKQLGLLPGNDMPRTASPAARRPANVPLMSNTRIRHDASPLGHVDARVAGPAARGPVKTRVRTGATAPANKAAPPLGTVHQTNLGRAGSGVQAA